MLFPRFSIRFTLLVTAIAAVFSLALAAATRGSQVAIGAMIGFGSLAVLFVIFMFVFAFAFGVSLIWQFITDSEATPFSSGGPNQVLPTQDAE